MGSYPYLQFGTFLTNHDINRIMDVLGNDEDRAKLAANFLLTIPGVPYLYYGEECLSFLKGMFAFVIIDKISGKIFAASDRFGIKPIYYGYTDNKKCFYLTSNFSPLVSTIFFSVIIFAISCIFIG